MEMEKTTVQIFCVVTVIVIFIFLFGQHYIRFVIRSNIWERRKQVFIKICKENQNSGMYDKLFNYVISQRASDNFKNMGEKYFMKVHMPFMYKSFFDDLMEDFHKRQRCRARDLFNSYKERREQDAKIEPGDNQKTPTT